MQEAHQREEETPLPPQRFIYAVFHDTNTGARTSVVCFQHPIRVLIEVNANDPKFVIDFISSPGFRVFSEDQWKRVNTIGLSGIICEELFIQQHTNNSNEDTTHSVSGSPI